jgi:hypothetical protein
VTTAPDGTLTADKIIASAGSATHRIQQTALAVTISSAYAFSVFVKASEYSKFGLVENAITGAYATFNLSGAGSVISTGLTGSGSITALANGWYRVVLTMTTTGAQTTFRPDLFPLPDSYTSGDPNAAYTGDGTSGIFIWGAQVELGGFASSYVPTVAASATRAADSLVYTAGVSYPASLWCEFERPQLAGGSDYLPSLYNTGANTFLMFLTSAGLLRTVVDAASVRQADFTIASPSATANTVHKAAARVATDNVRSVLNATLSAADTSATLPAAPTIYEISASPLFGYIRRAAVFNSALTDAQLTASTT